VLKTLGCAPTAKVNQLIACQSDGAPADASSPVTLLEWRAPGGIPDAGFDGIVFLTKFPEPGVKQISLNACSGNACTTLSQNVTVTADPPPGPQTLTGSGTFTLFEQAGQCDGLTIAEILQLSLSLTPNGASVTVNVTNKGWLGTFGAWTDEPGGKLLSATGQNLPNPPVGVTAYHFSIAGHYNTTTKMLAWDGSTGFSLFYDRSGGGRCTARYSFNIQLN
jgi:hypothetical protein